MAKEPKKEKEKKEVKPITREILEEAIEQMVNQMSIQAASRELVKSIVDNISSEYGVKKPVLRKAATIVFKQNRAETEQKDQEVFNLLDIVNAG